MRATSCTLSTDNLLHNLAVVRAKAVGAKIVAMVKANAYGHGLRSVAERLDGRVEALGVASIDEALVLRQARIETPIILMEGVFTGDELHIAAEQNFHVVFHNEQQLKWLNEVAPQKSLDAWLKIYTGMGRLGFPPETAADALKTLSRSTSIRQPVGILSHFACADEPDHPLNKQQIAAFDDFTRAHKGPKSLCNSAGIFAFPKKHYDWVRLGLALYGASPLAGQSAQALGLKPVMTFHTQLIAVQALKQGTTVGYGARFVCPEDMPIGIMAVGYGDGYPRSLPDGTPVLVDNTRCSLIGRVSMDMAAIDLRRCPNAPVGTSVTLWGSGLPVDDVAATSGHIAYDLLTGVQNRVKLEWVEASSS